MWLESWSFEQLRLLLIQACPRWSLVGWVCSNCLTRFSADQISSLLFTHWHSSGLQLLHCTRYSIYRCFPRLSILLWTTFSISRCSSLPIISSGCLPWGSSNYSTISSMSAEDCPSQQTTSTKFAQWFTTNAERAPWPAPLCFKKCYSSSKPNFITLAPSTQDTI